MYSIDGVPDGVYIGGCGDCGSGGVCSVGGADVTGGVSCVNHSPQNLHFLAVAIISSPQSGHLILSSILLLIFS